MDGSNDIGRFLAGRRAKLTPRQVGLASNGRRRVPGLRREEVAMLAGVSTDYYARLERGNVSRVSDRVLEAIAQALQLDDEQHAELRELAAVAADASRPRRHGAPPRAVRSGVQRILDGMTEVAAVVRNGRLDVLGTSRLGYAVFSQVFDNPMRPANLARFIFLDPRAHDFYPSWPDAASTAVALLRAEADRNRYDRQLSSLIGELSTCSEDFRSRWAARNGRVHRCGTKRFTHPAVGELRLSFEAMELSADRGLTMTAFVAEPNSPSADGLALLASWAATHGAHC